MSFLMFDVQKRYTPEEQLHPESMDTFAVLSRAKHYIFERDDITSAVRYVGGKFKF